MLTQKAIIAGSNSKLLAQKIATNTNIELLSPRVVHFINSEMKTTLPDNLVDFKKTVIVQSTSNPANDNFVEMALLADTLQREKIQDIKALVPYFGYARQDKQHLPHESVSIEVMIKLLKSVGISKVATVDIHNESAITKYNLPIQNISAVPFLAGQIYKSMRLNPELEADITIVSPDYGGIKRAELFAKYFYKNPKNAEIVSIKKQRHLDKTHYSEAVELRGEIRDKKVILIDDVSTSGGTLLNALELCKANGVGEVYCLVIHADFAKGVAEKFQNSDFKKLFTTNTIEKTVENLEFFDKIEVIDISPIFDEFVISD
jgi:ribose-phosphate pyrophosphokinase